MLVELRRLSMQYGWQCYIAKGDIDYPLSKATNDIINKSNFEERVVETANTEVFAELEKICGVCYKLGERIVGLGGQWKGMWWAVIWEIF